MADAIVSVVAEQIATILKEQISNEVSLVRGVENEIDSLSKELQNVRNKLEDAERKQFGDKSVRAWLLRLEDASYEMEDVLDEWHTALQKFQIQSNDAPKNKVCSFISCLCFQKVAIRRDIATKIKNVKVKLDLILAEKDRYGLMTSSLSTVDPSSWRVQSTSSVDLAEVHGRDIDRDVVASKIFVTTTSPSDQLETVSIVGVGGLGKTTLAQLVFSDSRVKDCFELAIWICVSDPFDVIEIIKKIVESVTRRSPDSNQLQVLVKLLKECIPGKKFLLVLDDVWTEDHTKWECLKTSLKSCGGIGSKVLVTTRKEKVAKTMDTLEDGIHRLGVLPDQHCWLLLKRITLFRKNEEECAKYKDIGMKIVGKCKGLPLAVKTLGSLLRFKNVLEEWENVLKSNIWDLEEAQVDIFPHLLLSYNELSPALKRCFSYCAVFPKDFVIKVNRVIEQWMALGYLGSDDIGSGGGGDMELRGQQFFDNLATRSLFQDFQRDYWGEITYFKLHDVVHDFAQFLWKNGTVGVEAGTNKKTSCQACSPYELVSQVKQYRTLFCDKNEESPICGCLGSLRVLRPSRNSRIPQGIEKLIHLRWLDLSRNFSEIANPSIEGLESICNELYNLQTLRLGFCNLEEVSRGIGNLIKLRFLDLRFNRSLKELPREIGKLIHLRHLDLSWNESLKELPSEIGNLIHLRHLNLEGNTSLKELQREIGNLINLTHLDLSKNKSLKELPSEIGNLIHLRHLNLSENTSLKELPSEIGNLIHLRHLILSGNTSLKELPSEIGNLIHLRHLMLSGNTSLKELPDIHRLVNLEHLLNSGTTSLMQFPQGIAQLTCLLKLSEFRVGKDMGKLGWLKNLNQLGGSLKLVINLTGGSDVEDVVEGELRNKEHLYRLEIEFVDENEIGVEDFVWMDVIDALQPHPNLQYLTIGNFPGSRLPVWIVSPLNQVKNIFLYGFNHLSSILLPLGKLPCLEEMLVYGMPELRFVGREFLGITTQIETAGHVNNNNNNNVEYFPNLKKLSFFCCPNWEEWEDITAQDEEEKVVSFMPHLTELNITECNSLKALPHRLLALSLEMKKLRIYSSTQLEQRYGDKEGLSPSKYLSNINPRIQLIIKNPHASSSS